MQLKSRLTINKKYSGLEKDIWIAFPYKGSWYLIRHDCLVDKVGKKTNWLNSPSWIDQDAYSSTSINPDLLESLAEDRLKPVFGSVLPDDSNIAQS